MRPQDISIKDYTYELPNDRIAQRPLPRRDASKLLIYREGNISQDTYRNIATHLPENSLLVINTTRVVRARVLFQKPTGGVIEIFCLAPHEHIDLSSAMSRQQKVLWQCLIGGASKWKAGQILEKTLPQDPRFKLTARYVQKLTDSFVIEFSWEPKTFVFAEIINAFGVLPLPPYIKREEEKDDSSRYQTIYGKSFGSVAAPTAGLHFTEEVFEKIKKKNITTGQVTLHVGAGTFKPVKSETMAGHDMHEEYFEVSAAFVSQLMQFVQQRLPITATGTTSLRAIESLYWLGAKLSLQPDLPASEWTIGQWEAYDLEKENIHVLNALQTLHQKIIDAGEDRVIARTQLLIAPGYSIKIPTALITNFHQPQSTLLLLVAAFVGKDWKKVYDYALENDFRFLSYGDGCLLFRK